MDQYRITVRRQRGPGSTRLHELRIGDRVGLRAPAGDFVLDMGGYRPVVLIAAGIG
jgi:ferredoxin-NADP reductase